MKEGAPSDGKDGQNKFFVDPNRKPRLPIEEEKKIWNDIWARLEKDKEEKKIKKNDGDEIDPEGKPELDDDQFTPGKQREIPIKDPKKLPSNPPQK